MKRINRKDQIPKWFSIANYSVLDELDDVSLVHQVSARINKMKMDLEFFNFMENARVLYSQYVTSQLEKVILNEEEKVEKKYSEMQMSGVGGVTPLSLHELVYLSKLAENYISENGIARSLRGRKRSVSKTISTTDAMVLSLDLSWPDEILLRDMSKLLPIWRQELGLQHESAECIANRFDVIKKKILDYKVIPMLDLMIWSKINDVAITNRVMALALFPDGEYDSTNIAQTIKPFIENFMSDFSIEKLKRMAMDKIS